MRAFAELYRRLDESNRTNEKVATLVDYFQQAPAPDAAWALWFLTGNRPGRAVNSRLLREWLAEETGLPEWMVEECYDTVGDLAETIALLLPSGGENPGPLHQVMEEILLPLKSLGEDDRRASILNVWRNFQRHELFVWNKMMLGGFRVGVSRTLVVRALAQVAGIDQPAMAHRIMGYREANADAYRRLLSGETSKDDLTRPYPFCLAHPLEGNVEELGTLEEWIVEWKWDGIRAQLLHRGGQVLIWSRGEELLTDRFPEITAAARWLPDGTVLDGEILAWREDQPLPFGSLQTRINRKNITKKLMGEVPVAFMVYDLLEESGVDRRDLFLRERHTLLSKIIPEDGEVIRRSPTVHTDSWQEVHALHEESRERMVEGFMLKHMESVYHAGRVKGGWWKWKTAPETMDAVLVYAQKGHGRRANLFTDYTFAAWDGDQLVPVAKAYSGLTDKEIREVDAWIRRNTTDRHGPVRVVKPELVFEIAFEGIQESKRHKSGIAVRFPRMARWRKDKPASEANHVADWKALLRV